MSRNVVVVGGGIVGCATAYFAAREGMKVTLLEKQTIAFGASGRNPGFVWLHCRNPGFALEISRAGRALYPQLLEELPGGFEFRARGGLIYFNNEQQGAVFEEFVAARRADGLDIELIDGAEVRRLVPPIRPDVLGASFCSEDAQINTPTVVRALAAGARREGADIREGVSVEGLVFSGEEVVGVETDHGRVEADAVVMAAGAWSNPLLKSAGIDLPVGGERLQVVATEPLPFQIQPVVYGPLATKQYTLFRELPSWDPELFRAPYESEQGIEMLQLVAQRASGEVLVGCPMDYPAEIDLRPTLSGLRATAEAIGEDFPALADAPVARTWAGVLPYTTDMVPVIDEARPGLFIAAGHVFGNAAGPVTGRLITQLMAGQEPEIDLTECRFGRPLGPTDTGVPARW
ncbi:MAG: FAD-binding oxidoreductase [Thermoleophilaceae bacterium]|nr:FAD-binding oxidoreductase [Thermoleophilaceae bacterium]